MLPVQKYNDNPVSLNSVYLSDIQENDAGLFFFVSICPTTKFRNPLKQIGNELFKKKVFIPNNQPINFVLETLNFVL